MAKLVRRAEGEYHAIVAGIHRTILSDEWTMTFVDHVDAEENGLRLDTRIYEKFVTLSGGKQYLTVTIAGMESWTIVTAIGHREDSEENKGGVGAEDKLTSIVAHALSDMKA